MKTEEKLSYFLTKSKILDNQKFSKKIRIAILCSFTLNGLEETLRVKCSEIQLQAKTYVSGYNQYNQEILNSKSGLYTFSPDITFLVLDTRDIFGNFFYSPYSFSLKQRKDLVEKKLHEIISLVKTFTNNISSKLIITNFCIPTYSSYGIFETKMEYGFSQMISDLNSQLTQKLMSEPLVYLYDFNGFVIKHGEKNTFDYRQYFFGDVKVSINYIPYLANDFMSYIKALTGLNKKCIVLDLDNTLWGGIVGEEDFNGIKLGDDPIGKAYVEFQRHLLALYERGIILTINSKNNPEDAMKIIKDHPHMILREENFACIKINWNDKISNIKEISKELNIGLDSMVYFDDDPVNRELVRTYLPEVITVELPKDPSYYSYTLLNMNDFNVLKITEEDKKRGVMYLQQRKRIEFEKQTNNLDDFLKNLNICVKIKKTTDYTIPRISQLTLKTNQFNLTTHRYQEEDIRNLSNNKNKLVGCVQVEDKFGDNGITSVYIINKDNNKEWIIDTFLLSCRVMGRGVEDGILSYIIQQAKKSGVTTVKGHYIPTQKNKPAANFLKNFGFKKEGDTWIFKTSKPLPKLEHLKVSIE